MLVQQAPRGSWLHRTPALGRGAPRVHLRCRIVTPSPFVTSGEVPRPVLHSLHQVITPYLLPRAFKRGRAALCGVRPVPSPGALCSQPRCEPPLCQPCRPGIPTSTHSLSLTCALSPASSGASPLQQVSAASAGARVGPRGPAIRRPGNCATREMLLQSCPPLAEGLLPDPHCKHSSQGSVSP